MNIRKRLLLLVLVVAFAGWFLFDLQQFLTLEYFQRQRSTLLAWKEAQFWAASLLYFLLYVLVAALSLPAAALLTLAGGALFGFWWGLLLVSFASTLGATLAFLLARTLLRDWVQRRFGGYLEPLNKGIEKDGVFYLFTLRLVPLFPFFLVNLVMGLTSLSTLSFYWVSQLGMLFGTALYVNLGAQLGLATTLPAVFSLGVLRAVLVLALFPWLVRSLLRRFRQYRLLRPFPKPRRFDTNLLVVGGGSAGLVTAYIAALTRAKVTLVEQHRMGGECLNTGCVPSKALLRSAGVCHLFTRAQEFGLRAAPVEVDFPAVMQRVRGVIKAVEPHDAPERYRALGVDCVEGSARLVSPWLVEVAGRRISARHIVLATGARPVVPDIPGLEKLAYLSSETVWSLEQLPQRLLVLGGGPIGCELAQAFARLGSQVTLVQRNHKLLPQEDDDVSELLAGRLQAEGVRLLLASQVTAFSSHEGYPLALVEGGAGSCELGFDEVLLALGRKPNTEGLGLEQLGLPVDASGAPVVNEYLQTAFPNIFACGDLIGPWRFTHMAAFQAWYASINSLFGLFRKFRVDYRVVPRITFTAPEVARVGLNEQDARAQGLACEITRYELADLDRALTDGETEGFIKVLTVPGKDRILGVSIVASHASELLGEFTLAMTHGLGLKKILGTIHVYPTPGEGNKYAAGAWQRQHAPVWLYPWLARFHRWRRGD
jgi:pyruvate/2-oxoglutarate dehydrogenase complex dihydrolipoamide dehydrogenase (E3) component/uncharacterized membrane protein YdjX (TVP38/TMEM64 family)